MSAPTKERSDAQVREVPEWLTTMEFCHLGTDALKPVALCGAGEWPSYSCGDYDGNALCRTCGRPTCPRCAQLDALEMSL